MADTAPPARAEADRHIQRAAELRASGQDGAQAEVEQAVAMAPKDPYILTRAAAVSFDNQQFERSRELLRAASEQAPEGFELAPLFAHVGGRLAQHDGLHDVALELLRIAFDAHPARGAFGSVLAEELLKAGRYDDARGVVSAACEAGAEDADLPALERRLDAIAAAEAELARARDAGEADPAAVAALRLGESLEDYDPERARAAFEEALATATDPSHRATASLQLGSLLGSRDPAGAQRHYEDAMAIDDPLLRSVAAFNLAGLVLRAGDPVQARALYEAAAGSPDAAVAEHARAQLASLG